MDNESQGIEPGRENVFRMERKGKLRCFSGQFLALKNLVAASLTKSEF